jgi:hypothetical protein
LGILDKTNLKDRYKTDFIVFHRKEIDWFAFILILFIVNTGLIYIEESIVFADSGEAGPLRPLMYQLLVNHSLHLIFKRHYLGRDRKIYKGHKWIWIFNLISYSYIIYVYNFTDAKTNSNSDYSKCWIPLDCILMALVAMYYFGSKAIERIQDEDSLVVEEQPDESINDSKVEVRVAQGGFLKNLLAFAQRKKEAFDSIYDVEKPKVSFFKLKNDSSTLGFACFLKKD